MANVDSIIFLLFNILILIEEKYKIIPYLNYITVKV